MDNVSNGSPLIPVTQIRGSSIHVLQNSVKKQNSKTDSCANKMAKIVFLSRKITAESNMSRIGTTVGCPPCTPFCRRRLCSTQSIHSAIFANSVKSELNLKFHHQNMQLPQNAVWTQNQSHHFFFFWNRQQSGGHKSATIIGRQFNAHLSAPPRLLRPLFVEHCTIGFVFYNGDVAPPCDRVRAGWEDGVRPRAWDLRRQESKRGSEWKWGKLLGKVGQSGAKTDEYAGQNRRRKGEGEALRRRRPCSLFGRGRWANSRAGRHQWSTGMGGERIA